jgi:SAM-dependent methyltransferase
MTNISKTSSYWDRYWEQNQGVNNTNRAEWLGHPIVIEHHNKLRGGLSLDAWLVQKLAPVKPVKQALSIGAGVAAFELSLMNAGHIENIDLYEVSQVSINRAREQAIQYGIENRVRFFQQDINQVKLPRNRYDLVIFFSSLHHITDLNKVLEKVYRSLRKGGLLFAFEYVGPDRFAFPEYHTSIAKNLYKALDYELKCSLPELPLPNPPDVIEADPTEAVHSEQILETVELIFGNKEVLSLQGALTPIIWYGLNHDALFDTQKGWDFVQLLLELDDALISSGRLPTYFAVLTSRKASFIKKQFGRYLPLKN